MPFGIPKAKYESKQQLTEFIFWWIIALKTVCIFLTYIVAPFENDASPSRPVLYKLEED